MGDVDPLTGSQGDGCHIHYGVLKRTDHDDELAKVGENPIFQKVFGAMEQLRIDETERCLHNPKRKRWNGEFHRRKNPADLSFKRLMLEWQGRSGVSYYHVDWVFPFNHSGFS